MSRSCVNEYDVEPAPALMPTGASTPTMPSISDALAMSNLPTTEPNEPRVPNRSETLSLTDQTNLVPFKKVITVFSGLSLCILVSCLDSTIVATALPTISDAFDAGAIVSWVPLWREVRPERRRAVIREVDNETSWCWRGTTSVGK